MYNNSEATTTYKTCALNALHVASINVNNNYEAQSLRGENDVLFNNAGDLTDLISAAYLQDALLQAIVKVKKEELRCLPANLIDNN